MANFRAIGGGNVSVRYKEIAKAAANQTYAAQLTQLKTTWDTLTKDEKIRTIIGIYVPTEDKFDLYFPSDNNGKFTRSLAQSSLYVQTFYLETSNFYQSTVNSTGFAFTNMSSTNNPYILSLMLLCNY